MTTNIERAAEVIYSHMSSWDDETQATNAAQDLAEADLLMPDLALVDALIAEKQAHQELRARIGRLRDWHNERGELMHNLYEESLDRQFKDNSYSHSFTANQLSAILDPSDEDEADNG